MQRSLERGDTEKAKIEEDLAKAMALKSQGDKQVHHAHRSQFVSPGKRFTLFWFIGGAFCEHLTLRKPSTCPFTSPATFYTTSKAHCILHHLSCLSSNLSLLGETVWLLGVCNTPWVVQDTASHMQNASNHTMRFAHARQTGISYHAMGYIFKGVFG